MSNIKQISSLPDTKRTFNDSNNYTYLKGYFVTEKKNLFSSTDEVEDSDFWNTLLEDTDLTPLHYIKEIDFLDEETLYQESKQDFRLKIKDGKKRQKTRFTWTLEKHNIVDQLSGTDKYIIPYDRNGNVYLVEDGGYLRGIKTTTIELEEFIYATDTTPAWSPLDIQFAEKATLIHNTGFRLEDIDRLFMSLTIEYLDQDTLNFSASYNGSDIDSIEASDVTVTDDENGELTFTTFVLLLGTYKLSGFSDKLINGTLQVLSTLYLGCAKYKVVITVDIVNNMVTEYGDNMVTEYGNNMILEN